MQVFRAFQIFFSVNFSQISSLILLLWTVNKQGDLAVVLIICNSQITANSPCYLAKVESFSLIIVRHIAGVHFFFT